HRQRASHLPLTQRGGIENFLAIDGAGDRLPDFEFVQRRNGSPQLQNVIGNGWHAVQHNGRIVHQQSRYQGIVEQGKINRACAQGGENRGFIGNDANLNSIDVGAFTPPIRIGGQSGGLVGRPVFEDERAGAVGYGSHIAALNVSRID